MQHATDKQNPTCMASTLRLPWAIRKGNLFNKRLVPRPQNKRRMCSLYRIASRDGWPDLITKIRDRTTAWRPDCRQKSQNIRRRCYKLWTVIWFVLFIRLGHGTGPFGSAMESGTLLLWNSFWKPGALPSCGSVRLVVEPCWINRPCSHSQRCFWDAFGTFVTHLLDNS